MLYYRVGRVCKQPVSERRRVYRDSTVWRRRRRRRRRCMSIHLQAGLTSVLNIDGLPHIGANWVSWPHWKHTHTHPFNGPLSGTTRVSRYQKGKTNLDSTEARDSEWQKHWPPLENDEKLKSENVQKRAVFYVYVIVWEQSGWQAGVENGAMLTTYLFRCISECTIS